MLGVYAMKRVAAGANLPTPWLFEPATRPDDRADYGKISSFERVSNPGPLGSKSSTSPLRHTGSAHLQMVIRNYQYFQRPTKRTVGDNDNEPFMQKKGLLLVT